MNVFDPWARDRGDYYSLEWKPRPERDPIRRSPSDRRNDQSGVSGYGSVPFGNFVSTLLLIAASDSA